MNDGASHVARMERGRSAFKILTGKPTRKHELAASIPETSNNLTVD